METNCKSENFNLRFVGGVEWETESVITRSEFIHGVESVLVLLGGLILRSKYVTLFVDVDLLHCRRSASLFITVSMGSVSEGLRLRILMLTV